MLETNATPKRSRRERREKRKQRCGIYNAEGDRKANDKASLRNAKTKRTTRPVELQMTTLGEQHKRLHRTSLLWCDVTTR
jgi:hypothetical protein